MEYTHGFTMMIDSINQSINKSDKHFQLTNKILIDYIAYDNDDNIHDILKTLNFVCKILIHIISLLFSKKIFC